MQATAVVIQKPPTQPCIEHFCADANRPIEGPIKNRVDSLHLAGATQGLAGSGPQCCGSSHSPPSHRGGVLGHQIRNHSSRGQPEPMVALEVTSRSHSLSIGTPLELYPRHAFVSKPRTANGGLFASSGGRRQGCGW